MGTDKATLGEPPWAHRVAAALEGAGCDPVVLLGEPRGHGSAPARLARGAWAVVHDARPGSGPATAIADHMATLAAATPEPGPPGLVVAASDLPALTDRDVQRLVSACPPDAWSAYELDARVQRSLVAVGPEVVRRIGTGVVRQHMSMKELLGPGAVLLEPLRADSVADVDH